MSPLAAWLLVVGLYVVPLLHVLLSPRGGPFLPSAGSSCPFGPRAGWFVMVLLLGPIGWLLYMRARGRRRNGAPARSRP